MNAAESRRKAPEQFLILGMTPRTLGVAAITFIGTVATALTLVLTAVNNAAQQVRQIRDDFLQRPPTTSEDLNRLQNQIEDATRDLKQDVRDSVNSIDVPAAPTVTVTTPRVPVERPASPPAVTPAPVLVSTPAPTPKPTPTPAPRLLPPLPPLLP